MHIQNWKHAFQKSSRLSTWQQLKWGSKPALIFLSSTMNKVLKSCHFHFVVWCNSWNRHQRNTSSGSDVYNVVLMVQRLFPIFQLVSIWPPGQSIKLYSDLKSPWLADTTLVKLCRNSIPSHIVRVSAVKRWNFVSFYGDVGVVVTCLLTLWRFSKALWMTDMQRWTDEFCICISFLLTFV